MGRLVQGFKVVSHAQKMVLTLVVGESVIGVIALVVWTNRLGGEGHSILIRSGQIYDTRLQLATRGLPQGGGVGFEIFDRTSFGMTDFIQQLNYQRALRGELSRTINHSPEVEKSRVHLSIPKKSLFVEDQKEARASVILRLKQGRNLNPNQVQGIVHLVASRVEGLSPVNVRPEWRRPRPWRNWQHTLH